MYHICSFKVSHCQLGCAKSGVQFSYISCEKKKQPSNKIHILCFIWQIAGGSSSHALRCLYISLVLPILQYGLPAWYPYTATLSAKLEGVQRRASRMCLKQRRGDMPYEERLKSLNWMSLPYRRQQPIPPPPTEVWMGSTNEYLPVESNY